MHCSFQLLIFKLWTPEATHIDLALRGVEIIGNGSGSVSIELKLIE